PTKWTWNLRLDPNEPYARKSSVRNGNRREDHQSLVRGGTPAKNDTGSHEDGEGDHLLKFECEKLWCVVRMSNLPHLIHQGCGQAKWDHQSRYGNCQPTKLFVPAQVPNLDPEDL